MPIQAKGRFPKPATTYKDGGDGGRIPGRVTIEEFRALKGMPRGDEALKLLQCIGQAVKPIMIKHGWRLPLLVEIYPKQQSLLGFNVNAGRKIALRLRHASNHNDFIDQESITETMLHELAHNLREPHDEIFFQHLDTLTREWYDLQSSSTGLLPGQGFLFGGIKLGGTSSASLSPLQVRQKAAEMAERRRRQAILMSDGGSGQRLDGLNQPSLAELAKWRVEAAERRRQITHNCPSSSIELTQDAAKEQEDEEILRGIEVITIDDDEESILSEQQQQEHRPKRQHALKREQVSSDEDDIVLIDVKRPARRSSPVEEGTTIRSDSKLVGQTRAAAALRHQLLSEANRDTLLSFADRDPLDASINGHSRSWTCQRCTLYNKATSLVCEACDDIRPGLQHWICTHCDHRMLGDYAQYWLCTNCGHLKTA